MVWDIDPRAYTRVWYGIEIWNPILLAGGMGFKWDIPTI